MYKHSHHYGLSTFQDHLGHTPLLTAFTFSELVPFDSTSHIQRLSFLLSKGCRIGEVDNNGFNCLHVFFSDADPPALKDNDDILRLRPGGKDLRDSLVYIVRQGADVYATDRLGRSVSEFAYSETCWSTAAELGSYCGDLWDAVLDLCGYDISQFRKGYPRRAMYTNEYSREDFERLWKGREGRCPYWDDEDWCSPEDAEHGASLGVLQAPLCVSLDRHCFDCFECCYSKISDDSRAGVGRKTTPRACMAPTPTMAMNVPGARRSTVWTVQMNRITMQPALMMGGVLGFRRKRLQNGTPSMTERISVPILRPMLRPCTKNSHTTPGTRAILELERPWRLPAEPLQISSVSAITRRGFLLDGEITQRGIPWHCQERRDLIRMVWERREKSQIFDDLESLVSSMWRIGCST